MHQQNGINGHIETVPPASIALDVLKEMRKQADERGVVDGVFVGKIAKDLNVSNETVSAAIDTLEDHEIIIGEDDGWHLPGATPLAQPLPENLDAGPKKLPDPSGDDRPAYDLAWVIASTIAAQGLFEGIGSDRAHSEYAMMIEDAQGIIYTYIRDYLPSYEKLRSLNLPGTLWR